MDISEYIGKTGIVKPGAPREVRIEYFMRKLTAKHGEGFIFEILEDKSKDVRALKASASCPKHGLIKVVSLRHLLESGGCTCKQCNTEA